MPRSNRPRHRRTAADDDGLDLDRVRRGLKRVESKRSGEWNVQPVTAAGARKPYVCPGCRGEVSVGVAHLVTWRADALLGDQAALADRRHWHEHCWRIAP
ncbi:hypothetical protein GCM10009792_00110 [Microcella alkalica]|uniref:ATP/GTP-binding protein n=1 Tax=Microcella alkalica TaxID=355930 RepID=A0A839EA53_9MICO|nr:hypothetical protein [Microcella alkalica]